MILGHFLFHSIQCSYYAGKTKHVEFIVIRYLIRPSSQSFVSQFKTLEIQSVRLMNRYHCHGLNHPDIQRLNIYFWNSGSRIKYISFCREQLPISVPSCNIHQRHVKHNFTINDGRLQIIT